MKKSLGLLLVTGAFVSLTANQTTGTIKDGLDQQGEVLKKVIKKTKFNSLNIKELQEQVKKLNHTVFKEDNSYTSKYAEEFDKFLEEK